MASSTRRSAPFGSGSKRPSVSLTWAATAASDVSIGSKWRLSVDFNRLARYRPVGADDDLVHLGLRLAQLGLAVTLQGRAAFVAGDRLVELALTLLQCLDQRLQLGQRLLEPHAGDVRRDLVGHAAPLTKGRGV